MRVLRGFVVLVAMAAWPCAQADAGTLYMRNGHPLIAAAGAPDFEEASTENGMRLDLTYLSVFVDEENDHWRTVVDMEAAVLDIRGATALGPLAAFGIDVPVYYYYAGVLDGPLDRFHGALGTGSGSRRDRPDDDYLYFVQRDGKTIIRGSGNQIALGDIRTWGKWPFHKGPRATTALYGFVDMPTGDAYRGYGNGSIDWGTALLADYRYDEDIGFFANLGRVFPGDYEGHGRIRLYDFFYAAIGVDWRYSGDTSITAQAMWGQSPYRIGIGLIDNDWVLGGLGVKHDVGAKGSMHLMFTEDLSTKAAPDFMLTLGYEYRL